MDHRSSHLSSLQGKVATMRAVSSSPGHSDLVLDETPVEILVNGLPDELAETFGLVKTAGGTLLKFERPPALASQAAWSSRRVNENDPFANALCFGFSKFTLPQFLEAAQWTDSIYIDVTEGSVFYCDPDDYAFYYENPYEERVVQHFADSTAAFFDEFVFGPRYPEIIEAVTGGQASLVLNDPAEVPDTWLSALRSADLL